MRGENSTQFFVRLLEDHSVPVFSGGMCDSVANLCDREDAREGWSQDPDGFLTEYRNAVESCFKRGLCDSFANTVQHTVELLKLIDINVCFHLDPDSLAALLVTLSDRIQMLDTIYKQDKYDEYMWGYVISFKSSMLVHKILMGNHVETDAEASKTYMMEAISKMPATNAVLAGWIHSCSKQYGFRIPKTVTQAVKVLLLYDQLLGSGTADLLFHKTKEQAEKKLKPFRDVGMEDISDKILDFYLCETGNQKKRFLSELEAFMGELDMPRRINDYLRNCHRG